jgi:hypothetical protein
MKVVSLQIGLINEQQGKGKSIKKNGRVFMKIKARFISLIMTATLLSACGAAASPAASVVPATTKADTVSSASIVDNAGAFEKAIAKDGRWIIAITKDLTIDKELVLDGDFKNGKKDDKGNEIIQRKIALYAQDDKRVITARYTLTAPKLTINSALASIQHGTFKGDVYVNVKDFQLIDAKVDGNIYFASEEVKSSFKMDAKSSVTGKQELKK